MCDGKDDCANGEDEMGCPAQTTPTSTTTTSTTTTEAVVECNENEYLCPSVNACFSKCNTALICPDVPKEVHCPDCPEFKCQYSGLCISSASVCNGVMDCPQNEDEENCCRPGQFQCGNGLCVDKDAICDGKYDCIDAADERDCSKFPLSHLYPDLTIHLHLFVFQISAKITNFNVNPDSVFLRICAVMVTEIVRMALMNLTVKVASRMNSPVWMANNVFQLARSVIRDKTALMEVTSRIDHVRNHV